MNTINKTVQNEEREREKETRIERNENDKKRDRQREEKSIPLSVNCFAIFKEITNTMRVGFRMCVHCLDMLDLVWWRLYVVWLYVYIYEPYVSVYKIALQLYKKLNKYKQLDMVYSVCWRSMPWGESFRRYLNK